MEDASDINLILGEFVLPKPDITNNT